MAVFAATAAAAAVLAMMGVWWWPATFLALGLLVVLQRLAGKGRVLDPERLRRGIRGEEAVANALAGLPSSYLVLHGLSTGHGDVDHVVIGPTGVFAIETKAWEGTFYRRRGQLYSNGKPADHVLRQARGGAGQVRTSSCGRRRRVGRGGRRRLGGLRFALPRTLPEGLRPLDQGRGGLHHEPESLARKLDGSAGGDDVDAAGRGGPLGRGRR